MYVNGALESMSELILPLALLHLCCISIFKGCMKKVSLRTSFTFRNNLFMKGFSENIFTLSYLWHEQNFLTVSYKLADSLR